ncbi:MAG: RNase adapter RapZ [Candidatus Binatia bacterium]
MTTERPQVVIVTGLSGSGKSTAIHVLEDLGFYCIDNLPSILLPKFLELCEGLGEGIRRVALGIDLRERAFFHEALKMIDLIREQGHQVDVVFFDAADEVLLRRFSETRRPHPQAQGGSPIDGIRREREKLSAIREAADRIIDTTALTVHQLRAELRQLFGRASDKPELAAFIVSFGYKFGMPTDADMVLDVRFLPNPYFVDELRARSGLDEAVTNYVLERDETQKFLKQVRSLLRFLLPLYRREGKSYFTLALGCTGGRHRSVVLAEEVARSLADEGYWVQTRHRDVER